MIKAQGYTSLGVDFKMGRRVSIHWRTPGDSVIKELMYTGTPWEQKLADWFHYLS